MNEIQSLIDQRRMTMKQHPLSAAFPAMSAEDFAALVEDIESNGQREPIMTMDGMVLDGWHRYSACMQLGIKAQIFTFPADKDPVAFVKSHNLHRRHMTASQRAVAIVACSEWVQRGKPSSKPETISGLREKDMAKEAGTSDRTIRDAKVAHKAGLGDAVKDGAMTAHEAANVARGKTPEKPKNKPTEPIRPVDSAEVDSLREKLVELTENLKETLADNESMARVFEADDKVKAALAEAKRYRELNRILEERIAGLMNEKNAAIRSAKSWQRKAEAAERAQA